jgi:hypothetical protein
MVAVIAGNQIYGNKKMPEAPTSGTFGIFFRALI